MENKNKRKFNAQGIVAFFAFWLLIASFLFIFQTCTQAIEPMPSAPSDLYGTVYNATNVTQTALGYISGIYNAQYTFGAFDSFVPVLMFRQGTQIRLLFTNGSTPYDTDAYYTYDGAGQFNLSTGQYYQSARYLLTEFGFKSYIVGEMPSTVITENVLFYRDSSGVWVDNTANFATTTDSGDYQTLFSAYNRWLAWVNQLPPEGGGGDGDQIIVNELDIGSIIASLPQAARNILDSTFGFELFGINIAATLTAVLLVTIVAFVIKWLMSR